MISLTANNLFDKVAYNGFTGGLAPRTVSLALRMEF
jgi:hypothetical protein